MDGTARETRIVSLPAHAIFSHARGEATAQKTQRRLDAKPTARASQTREIKPPAAVEYWGGTSPAVIMPPARSDAELHASKGFGAARCWRD